MRYRLLRILLCFSALAWGISVVGVFAPWTTANDLLTGLGARPIAYDPMLDYWLRMASGAFALIGCFYLKVALSPRCFPKVIFYLGALMVIEGAILLVHGVRLHLPPFPFYCDTAFCLLAGGGIIALREEATKTT